MFVSGLRYENQSKQSIETDVKNTGAHHALAEVIWVHAWEGPHEQG